MEQNSLPSAPHEVSLPALPAPRSDEGPFRDEGFIFPALNWMARRSEIAALVIGLLVALCFVPHVLLFEERDNPERLSSNIVPFHLVMQEFEYRLYDARFSRRGPVLPASRDKIAIIKIDSNSLHVLDSWPWPRSYHARLIRRLKKAGARVIALDIDFSSKQLPRPNGVLSEEDVQLINATRDAGNVLFPSYISVDNKVVDGRPVTESRIVTPFTEDMNGNPGLDEQTADVSLAYLPEDSDGGYRRYPVYGTVSGADVGSFAALACGMYQGLVKSKGAADSREWQLGPYQTALKQVAWPPLNGKSVNIPARAVGFEGPDSPRFTHMLFHYWGMQDTFPSYSYSDVVNEYDEATLSKYFKGKIVFVGATDIILKDIFPMPAMHDWANGKEFGRETIPGVELHATAAAMMLDGTYIRPPKMYITLWCLFGLTLFSAAWTEIAREHISRFSRLIQIWWHKRKRLKRLQFRVQDSAWFAMYAVVALLPAFVFWLVCVYFFLEQGRWVVAAYPVVSSVMSSAVVLIFLFTIESAERRKVIYQMGLYMDRDVMEEVLSHPEGEYAKPSRMMATVLFTDLEGFTSYSEEHNPDIVVSALNMYMTVMRPIIKEYGGIVDKYIGDAIMASFGVPVERYDHAERALACAIALQDACARFREETGINFKMRIGIHTGEVIAGSVGADGVDGEQPHFNYTVIGDTVNLASRLEGKNKEFGSWIMCSADTYFEAPDVVEVVSARAQIKGKSSEVEVYIVRGMKGELPRDANWGGALDFDNLHDQIYGREGHEVLSPEGGAQEPESPILPGPIAALPPGQSPAEGREPAVNESVNR